MKVYIDGAIYDESEARVSVLDHGLLYGDGVFEGIRAYGGRVFKLREHLKRLYAGARVLMIEVPMDEDAMARAVEDTVRANGERDAYIRLVVTRGKGSLGLDPRGCPKPSVIIIAGSISLYPGEYYERGIAVVTSATRRSAPDVLEPRVKSLNYLNNIMAKIEAANAGCMEAVMLNSEGYVAECTADNIFVVKDGALKTPSPHLGALDGITMRTVLDLSGSMGINASLAALTRYDLYTADECFLTGTGAEMVPVASVDGRKIGRECPGPLTRRLTAGFRDFVLDGAAAL